LLKMCTAMDIPKFFYISELLFLFSEEYIHAWHSFGGSQDLWQSRPEPGVYVDGSG
jgi:hypothetical protein